jgi:hypothetical protein
VRELYICFDGDEAGRDGVARLAEDLRREGLRAVVVSLSEGRDINDVVRTGGAAAVEALLRAADPGVAECPSFPFHRSHHGYEKTAGGFRLNLSGRVYEVKGMGRSPTHLRCAVRASLGPAALGTPGLPPLRLRRTRRRLTGRAFTWTRWICATRRRGRRGCGRAQGCLASTPAPLSTTCGG